MSVRPESEETTPGAAWWSDRAHPDVATTDISVADWLEVIRADDHEMPGAHGTPSAADLERPLDARRDCDWMADPIVSAELVIFLEIECLKRARYHAYVPAN